MLRFTSSLQLLVQESSVVLFPSVGWESNCNGFDDPSFPALSLSPSFLSFHHGTFQNKQWKSLCDWGETLSQPQCGRVRTELDISQFCISHFLALLKDLLSSLLMQSSFGSALPNGTAGDGSARVSPQETVLCHSHFSPLKLLYFMQSWNPLYTVRTVRKAQKTPPY